jgi:transposase InsO family protein
MGGLQDNGTVERFNDSLRDECLNVNLSLEDAYEKIESWRQDYNQFRPHSSLDNQTLRLCSHSERLEKSIIRWSRIGVRDTKTPCLSL